MAKKNELTTQEFWKNNWKNLNLPARHFTDNYSHIIIDRLFSRYISNRYKNFLEIGGCPGRWADYFYHKFNLICDSMDYDEYNVKLTKLNYELLKIKGKVFQGDITKIEERDVKKKYDIVFSDGLIEHFLDSSLVVENHTRFLDSQGLLIMGVPNIKKSWFYNFWAKKDSVAYQGYRHVSRKELRKYALDNGLEILFCDYVGVFNIGLVHSFRLHWLTQKMFIIIDVVGGWFLKTLRIKKESPTFSPYIFLIARKK